MAETFPGTLQQKFNAASFAHKLGKTAIETEMAIGRPKKRRRFSKDIKVFSGTINLSYADYNTLETFYNTTLNGGVKTFNYDHPFTGALAEFQFVDEPEFSPLGNGGLEFRVSFNWRLIE